MYKLIQTEFKSVTTQNNSAVCKLDKHINCYNVTI